MTAAARQLVKPEPPRINDLAGGDGAWIKAAEAARLLDANRNALTRRCAEDLQSRRLAVFARPGDGGQPQWFISRAYDARLVSTSQTSGVSGVSGADGLAKQLQSFPGEKVDEAWTRVACVKQFREHRAHTPGQMKDWLPGLIVQLRERFPDVKISRSRIYQWDKLFNHDPNDVVKLIDSRGGNTIGRGDPAAWKAFQDIFCDPRQPSLSECWRNVRGLARRHHWQWCSEKSCRRQLNDRIPPEVQLYHRDPAAWRNTQRPSIAQDVETHAAGECWIGDHKQCDVWVRHGKRLIRPWLTAWMDWRTRRVVGWCLSDNPNSSTILAALRHGLADERNFGGPSKVWIDNGKDYDSYIFHGQTKSQRLKKKRINEMNEPAATGLFNLLGIEAHFSLAYNPNGKSRLERWFRTLEPLFQKFESYAGKSVDTRPEELNNILADPRKVPTWDDFRRRIDNHITGNNARTEHAIDDLTDPATGQQLSPDDALQAWCPRRRQMADPDVMDLLLKQWHKPVTAQKNGVAINIGGKRLRYGGDDQRLIPYKSARKADRPPLLIAFDPHNLQSVRVYDIRYRFLFTLTLNGLGGVDTSAPIGRGHVGELIRRKRQRNHALKFIRETDLSEIYTDEESLAIEAAKDAAPTRDDEPGRNVAIVQTPIDGQSKHVQREEWKQAAGAEFSIPDVDEDHDMIRSGMPSLDRLDDLIEPTDGDDDMPFSIDDYLSHEEEDTCDSSGGFNPLSEDA